MFEKISVRSLLSIAAVAVLPSSVFAATTLNVSLGDSIRPVTHVASGSLYGFTETLPSNVDADVAPLKPNVFLAPARSGNGRQQPIGGAFLISPRLKNTTAKVQIRLADILPGWPYKYQNWDSWEKEVTSVINDKKSSAVQNFDGYEIWNEPNDTWKGSDNFERDLWKPTYDLIRKLDPGAKIIGPSYSYYNSSRMENFLKFCVQNNCLPDVISWHQWGSEGFVGALENLRSLEKKYNISPRAISINEYSDGEHTYEGCPGISVPFIAKFERHGVESAMISWWFVPLPGRLGSLLTAQNQRGGGWHLYKWYGDMSGYMAKVTPPNDKSAGVDGFAAVDAKQNYASVVIGGNTLGDVNVVFDKIPAFLGGKVKAIVERVVWKDKDTAVPKTDTLSTKEYTMNGTTLTVPLNIESKFYGYRVYLTPVNVPLKPYKDVIELPGKVEAENYDVAGQGFSYFDNDAENRAGDYREDGVDIEKAGDNYVIGYTEANEWLKYSVDVVTEGEYEITANVAAASDTKGFKLFLDDEELTGEYTIPATGEDWKTYKVVKVGSAKLTAGKHVLKLQIDGPYVNIDWVNFAEPVPEVPETPETADSTDVVDTNSIAIGQFVDRMNGLGLKIANEAFAVFDLNGTFLGKVAARDFQSLRHETRNLVKKDGLYIAKSLKSGSVVRLNISR